MVTSVAGPVSCPGYARLSSRPVKRGCARFTGWPASARARSRCMRCGRSVRTSRTVSCSSSYTATPVGARRCPLTTLSTRCCAALVLPPKPSPRTCTSASACSAAVFDDVRETAQIRPLLPAEPTCAVLVTSRRRLAALEATTVPLDVLPLPDAVEIFRSVAGQVRLAGDPDGNGIVADIVERCGRLPLAIRIAAARYRVSATHRLADVKADLMDAHRALSVLDDGERSVAASISMSVADLPETLRTALVALAAHPGSDIEGRAAAAAIGTDTAHAAWCLDQLADRH
ncbi:MAG: hypothetical protein E6F99_30935, partial [Actinobacteria bacterium]